jgi:3-hydroxy-3-methylglutaryl CoA synthase
MADASGITAWGAYVPRLRLPLALIAGRAARDGGPEKAIAGHDEDAVTLAVAAAVDCLRGFERERIDAVYFASTTHPFREKQGAALIAKALDLRRDVYTTDVSGSLRAGTLALESGLHAVKAGAARRVLVLASDCRMGAPRGALEAALGDAAAAFLVGDSDSAADLLGSHAIADEIQDVWRSDGERFTHSWEERFAIQEGYAPNLVEGVRGLCARLGAEPADFARAALYGPDARSLAGVVRRLGLEAGRVQDAFFGRLGNAGAAFAPLLLVAALERARPGERLLVASYGDGAHALAFEVTERIQKVGPRLAVSGHLARRHSLPSYDTYLRARDLQPVEWEPGRDPGLSATVRFRERDADIAFLGARCRACGQVHFPRPRVCYRCHARDDWEPHRLSDRRGRVLAYTFDHFFPAAEPPTTVVVVEVDGCRVQLQMDARPEEARLELPVEFAFRRIHEAGRKPNYFWKAVPLRGDAEAPEGA